MTIKTRFAPSPTGFLHVGGLRTALYAYLYAKKHNGSFILRVEDTDRARLVEGSVEAMVRSLAWGGIDIDEGVKFDDAGNITQVGENGPYIQSERLDIYKKHMDELLEKGHAYHCFCTRERLDDLRKMQETNKMPTGYDGHCREMSKEDVQAKIDAGEKYVIRLKMPKEGVTSFEDLVRGKVEFKNELIDDQVLMKSDGFPTYHFAVVVDDHLMEITHVIRGEEWISSTPKHIMLYEMFGWDKPQFAHLSLLVNEKKAKLSKRHGDVAVEDFKEKGYLPEALINFISFLGWNPGDEREIFSLAELEKEFDFDKVAKSAAVFNREKLAWYNQQYIKGLSNEQLASLALPYLKNAGIVGEDIDMKWLESVVALEKERMEVFTELPESLGYIFADSLDYEPELLVWKKSTRGGSKEKLELLHAFLSNISEDDWTEAYLEENLIAWIKENEYGVGDVLWPMRTALSGRKNSPGPFEIAGVLGKDVVLERVLRGSEGLV
jgi:nondiscriminating glutamyl-tRNA synthetase